MLEMVQDESRQVLRMEHDAVIGSFTASFRFDLKWDNEKFIRLCWALHEASKQHRGAATFPRDLSQIFWWCGTFVPLWVEQTDFSGGTALGGQVHERHRADGGLVADQRDRLGVIAAVCVLLAGDGGDDLSRPELAFRMARVGHEEEYKGRSAGAVYSGAALPP